MKLTKRFITIILIALLLFGSGMIISYSTTKEKVRNTLESTTFEISDFDILAVNESFARLWIQITVQEPNNSAYSLPNIAVKKITFDLLQDNEVAASFIFYPKSGNIITSTFEQEINIPLSLLDKISGDLMANIISSTTFALPFSANIEYKILGITNSLSFTNAFLFTANRSFKFVLDRIELPPINETNTFMHLNITNPFTSPLVIGGSADILFDTILAGTMNATPPINISSGFAQYIVPLTIVDSIDVIINLLLSEGFTNATLHSHLFIQLPDLQLPIPNDLPIYSTTASVLTFSVPTVHSTEINTTGVSILDFDLFVENYLPIDINVSAFYMNATLVDGKYIGSLLWNTSVVSLYAFNGALFEHATGLLNITAADVLRIGFDGGISIPDAILVVENHGIQQYIRFSIDFLALNL